MGDVDVTTAQDGATTGQVSRPVLTAMVIGSMVGAGVFTLPARFGTATGGAGALVAWTIAGTGMLMLAFCFQTLAIRKPELDSGVFIHVGQATVLGFLSVLAIFSLVTMVSYGAFGRAEIAGTRQPSMVGLFEQTVGSWDEWFISAGVIVSVLGCLPRLDAHGGGGRPRSRAQQRRAPRVFAPAELALSVVIVVGAVSPCTTCSPVGSSCDPTFRRSLMTQPSDAYGVHSEVGQLRKVLVCAPGLAHERLTPTNCDDLLFDDVLWVQNAQRDHLDFIAKMRERGIEVVELHDLLAETLADPRGAGVAARPQDRRRTRSGSASSTRPARSSTASTAQAGRVPHRRALDDRPPGRLPPGYLRPRPRVAPARATTSCRRCRTRSTRATPRAGSTAA